GGRDPCAARGHRTCAGRTRDARVRRARDRPGALHLGALRPRDRHRLRGGAAVKPVLLVTGHAPPDRAPAFAALDEREGIEVALFGGPSQHGAAASDSDALTGVRGETYDVAVRRVSQREVGALTRG